MNHLCMPRFSRFTLTLLICILVCCDLSRLSLAADLTASSAAPAVNFDDTETDTGSPEWRIVASSSVAFLINDNQTHQFPFASTSAHQAAPSG